MGVSLSRRRSLLLALLCSGLGALALAAAVAAGPERRGVAPVPHFAAARIGEFPLEYSAPGAITEVRDPAGSGEKVLALTVSNHDVHPLTPTDNPRAELGSPDMIRSGADVWLATRFLVPDGYPRVDGDGWVTLVSVYGPPFYGTSPWRLELSGEGLQWERNSTYGFDTPFRQPLVRGRWTAVLLHERFGRRGFVEMWVDGRPVEFFSSGRERHARPPIRRLRMATMDHSNDEGPNSVRIGQYREAGMFPRGTIYFGPLEVGPTRASVVPG